MCRSFCVITGEGDCYEFLAGDNTECQVWMSLLKFLIIFPYSTIPVEPKFHPSMFDTLDSKLYRAGEVHLIRMDARHGFDFYTVHEPVGKGLSCKTTLERYHTQSALIAREV